MEWQMWVTAVNAVLIVVGTFLARSVARARRDARAIIAEAKAMEDRARKAAGDEEYRALMAGRPGPVVAGPDRCPPNIPLTPAQGRCMRCGAEAWPSGGLMHRPDCPNAQERP